MISKIGKYPVEAELGRGGFGVVYRAYDPNVGRSVAIKVLTAESDSELFKRFQDEVGTTGNLTHKNIVIVYESGNESGVPYLVMELLSGRTLQEIIKNAVAMPLLEKVRIMTQVADGLRYAHEKNVIHRDVKPGNVMVLTDGNVKIMDFGIARVTTRSTVVTREGFIIGTIPYMAPEQFQQGGTAGKQTDIFAYGVTYYELLTGKHPFASDDNIYGTMERIKFVEPEPVSKLIAECPEGLELLICRAMAKEPEIRYVGFEELLLDSEAVLSDLAHEQASRVLREVPSLIEAGELEEAEDKLRQVAELEPGNREARPLRKAVQDEKERRKIAARLPALLDESENHIRERRFAEAVQTLETAMRLARNEALVEVRLAEARVKLEAHRHANKLVSEARRDQQRGQLGEALQRLKTALSVDSHHTEAQALFARLEAEQRRRERERYVQQAVEAASAHLGNKRYDQALAVLAELGTAETRVGDLRAHIERERAAEARRKQADQFNAAVSDVREALRAQDLTRAGDLIGRLSSDFGGAPETAQHIEELRDQLDAQVRAEVISAYSQQARHLIRQKWFPEALNLLEEATGRFPDDAGLKRLRDSVAELHAVQQRSEAMAAALDEANALLKAGDLEQALESVANSRRRIGEDKVFDDLQSQIEAELERHRYAWGLDDLLSRARALLDSESYAEAVSALHSEAIYIDEAEVRSLLASARSGLAMLEEQQFVNSAIEAVGGFEQQGMLDQASSLLRDARERYPHNRSLAQAAERVRQSIAKEQRRTAIAGHRTRIEEAIREAQWKIAEAAVQLAQREYPEEALFEAFGDQVRRALFDASLEEAASIVREKLAANAVADAVQQLDATRPIYRDDPRWKQLEEEVAERKAYESAIGRVNSERRRGEFAKAELLLTGLIQQRDVDQRLTQMLADIRNQRMSGEFQEAERAISRGDLDHGLTLMESLRLRTTPEWASRVEEAYQEARRKKAEETARVQRQRERDQQIWETVEQVRAFAAQREFEPALVAVSDGLSRYPDSTVLTSLRESVVAQARMASLAVARRFHQERNLVAALEALEAALRIAPDDPELLDLMAECESGIELDRRQQQYEHEVEEAENHAAALLGKGKQEDVIALIEGGYRDEPRLQALLGQARMELAEKQLAELLSRAQVLEDEGDYAVALQLVEEAIRRFGRTEEFAAREARLQTQLAEKQLREAREKDLAELVSIEHQVESGLRKRKKLRQLGVETSRIGSTYGADDEIASIATRLNDRIASALAAPASAPRFPWKLGAFGLAALIAIGAILLWVFRRPPAKPLVISTEIRTDPPGASVTVGDRSCFTPRCQLLLAPGRYSVQAHLDGYKPAQRTLVVESSNPAANMDLRLEPIPKPAPPFAPKTAGTGTLIVRTGIADARVFVDNVTRGETDSTGLFRLPLEPKDYKVRVEKSGYNSQEQRVTIAKGGSLAVGFKLVEQSSRLELHGAPAGVEVRLGGAVLGRTAGSVFSAQVPTGNQTLQVTYAAATRQISQNFETGKIRTLEWKDVAPSLPSTPPPPPVTSPEPKTAAMAELKDWNEASVSSDPARVEAYLDRYPSGVHSGEAKSRLDDLAFSESDPQTYLKRFPKGAHAPEAERRIEDAVWSRVDKNSAQAVSEFVSRNPGSRHLPEAQRLIDQINQRTREAAEGQKQQGSAGNDQVLAALARFNAAFEHKQQRELKAVWPGATRNYLEAVNTPHGAFKLAALQPAEFAGDQASLLCITQSRQQVRVTFEKRGVDWIIASIVALR